MASLNLVTFSDEQIGANVARLRANRSQADVAKAMRLRGFKWSQATVWSVEKGERPLRLTEAGALADILDKDLAHFYQRPELSFIMNRAEVVDKLRGEIRTVAFQVTEAQRYLALALDLHPDDLPPNVDDEMLECTAVDWVIEGMLQWQRQSTVARQATVGDMPRQHALFARVEKITGESDG